jgi:Tol biopolymer transport system component
MKRLILFLFAIYTLQNVTSQSNKIIDAQFSPNGDAIAFTQGITDHRSDLYFYSIKSDTLIKCTIASSGRKIWIRDFKFSPSGDAIAMILVSGANSDIYVYLTKQNKIVKCTDLGKFNNFDLAYKTDLYWCDNHNILFLSKHSGITQQYIVDLYDMSLKQNGASNGPEYFLSFSPKHDESYYVSVSKYKEPSVYRRKRDSAINIEISKDGANHMDTELSDEENYLSYTVMPEFTTPIYDLNNSKLLKTKLPKTGVTIAGWHEKDSILLYKYYHFDAEDSKTDIVLYNYINHKKQIIAKNLENSSNAKLSPDGSLVAYSKFTSPDSIATGQTKTLKIYKPEDIQTFITDRNGKTTTNYFCGKINSWSKDSKSILFETGEEIILLDVTTGKRKLIYRLHQ